MRSHVYTVCLKIKWSCFDGVRTRRHALMQGLNQEVYILAYSLLASRPSPASTFQCFTVFSFLPPTQNPEVSRPGSSVSHPGQKPLCADVTTPPSVRFTFFLGLRTCRCQPTASPNPIPPLLI